LQRFGRIDILVNNAGIMRKAYVKDMTPRCGRRCRR
jgi:NAD(P)-dependent dehydrogenase (short-subunit alcohol dehydrogenase family)